MFRNFTLEYWQKALRVERVEPFAILDCHYFINSYNLMATMG